MLNEHSLKFSCDLHLDGPVSGSISFNYQCLVCSGGLELLSEQRRCFSLKTHQTRPNNSKTTSSIAGTTFQMYQLSQGILFILLF